MNYLKKTIFLMVSFFAYGCSDYQSGYQDGLGGLDKNQWIVFGKSEYTEGFQSGQAEKFQQDWLSENPVEEDGLQCRTYLFEAGYMKFTLEGYKEVAKDVYQSN